MTLDPLTCPYCNAHQPPSPGLVVGQKVACARCGESVPVTHLPAEEAAPAPAEPAIRSKPVRANRLVAGVVLGVMLIMAGTGLTYALLTVQTRRDHDRALPRKSRRPWLDGRVSPPEEVVGPGELVGLRYLPTETGVIAAVHVEELLASPAGKELRSKAVKLGPGDFQLDNLKEWTGLGIEEIDHALLGVVVRDGGEADLTPPTHLIVCTRKPYDPARVRAALKASRPREERTAEGVRRTIYSASVRSFPVQLWLADERTVVVGLFSKLDLVPGKPHEGLASLPVELSRIVEKRLPANAPAWVAGYAADWKKTWLPALAQAMKGVPLAARLGEVNTFALWLVPSSPAKVAGAFRCADEETAKRIEKDDLAPRGEALKFSRDGAWLDVQLTLDR